MNDDEPIGDRRAWYQKLFARVGMEWGGADPDVYSPVDRQEELQINEALLEGTLQPRNEWERRYLGFMGGPHRIAARPKQWIVCKLCKSEWQVDGYPAGQTAALAGIGRDRWLWPNICECCADKPKPKPVAADSPQKRRKDPYAD